MPHDFCRWAEYALRAACILCATHEEEGRLRYGGGVMVCGAWPRIHPRGLADTHSRVSTYMHATKQRAEADEPRGLVLMRHASRRTIALTIPSLRSLFFLFASLSLGTRPSSSFLPEILRPQQFLQYVCSL